MKQLAEMATEGKFGGSIRTSQAEYAGLPNHDAIFLKAAVDFAQETATHGPELASMRNLACHLLIVAYREASRKDRSAADALLNSFTNDYPGVAESSLLPRWSSLANASLAMREVAHSGNRLLIWQQASKQFQATSEFLNGLFPFLIVAWRAASGKSYNTSVFAQSFGQLVNQFSELTGGEDGLFYLFIRLSRPKIRNAIAHETAWLDSIGGKIRYTDGRENKQEYEMDLVEFMAIAAAGSHIAHAYLAALAVISVMESGNPLAIAVLPTSFSIAFSHPSPSNMA